LKNLLLFAPDYSIIVGRLIYQQQGATMNITYDKKSSGLYAKLCRHAKRQGNKILKTYETLAK
jgi:hypothetical protein